MPRGRIQLINQQDFTGGINLRADPFQLAENESPDLLNVDVDPRGGFSLRRGVAPFGTAPAANPHSIMSFFTSGGTKQVLVGAGTSVYWGNGGAWTSIGSRANTALRSVTFKDNVYIQDGTNLVLKWTGAAASTLLDPGDGTPTWNNNLDTPNGGDMPIAKCTAAFMGCVFVANTLENAVAFPNRVRWSHPNFPEDWQDYNFIDIDTGVDGDQITALVPMGDRLLVFKRRSIHAIFGEPPDAFGVVPVTHEVGTISQESTVITDLGVFFFAVPEGVMHYDGSELRQVFDQLVPALDGGRINPAALAQIQLGWGNRRLWLSVPWEGSTTRNRVFVLDPTLGETGAWVAYDLKVGPFLEYAPPGDDPIFMAAYVGNTRVLSLEQDSSQDDLGAGGVAIPSYYVTRWIDMGQPAVKKRWRRPEVVLANVVATTIPVEVYIDYDPTFPPRTFLLTTTATSTAAIWGVSLWGVGTWAASGTGQLKIERGAPLGNARAVALKFTGPTTGDWGVDSITYKVIPRRVRS